MSMTLTAPSATLESVATLAFTVAYRTGKQETMQFVVDRLTAFVKSHPDTMAATPQAVRSFLANLMTETLAFVMTTPPEPPA